MKRYFGYIRVSTQRQGAQGVSLQEQKSAIEAYAQRNGLSIAAWFEERVTAAKSGRRVFAQMLKQLERGKADGVVIHKIDRSARNLRDWADLGELIDRGIDVHFAHDALDLRSRGGRLSADIQAVVAADFIRNLREETRKGFYGRLKQGLYPLRAPIGYRDMGRGKPKEIDPVKGPLVREAFALYATGEWNFHALLLELERRGLRGWRDTPLSLNGLSTILNNPFYVGLVHIRKTGETFEGRHAPLISKALYDDVQAVLRGRKQGSQPTRHAFLFKRFIRCADCGRCLTGERQRQRHVYYRCHSKTCSGISTTQGEVEATVRAQFSQLALHPVESGDLRDLMEELGGQGADDRAVHEKSLRLRLAQLQERLTRLTDALIEGLLDRITFEERKAGLLDEKYTLLERLENIENEPTTAALIAEMFERANTAQLGFETGTPEERRIILQSLGSNLQLRGRTPVFTLKSPYQELVNLRNAADCDPRRGALRTNTKKIFKIFVKAAKKEIQSRQSPQSPNVPDHACETRANAAS